MGIDLREIGNTKTEREEILVKTGSDWRKLALTLRCFKQP